jgi:hypothetical protein
MKRSEMQSAAPSCSPSVEEFLAVENRELRIAGCKLAEAALHVAREYDGVHRLMLAVAEWAKAVADEGGRGRANPEGLRTRHLVAGTQHPLVVAPNLAEKKIEKGC